MDTRELLLKFSSIQTLTVGTVVSTVPPEVTLQGRGLYRQWGLSPRPGNFNSNKDKKNILWMYSQSTFWWNSSTLPGTKKPRTFPNGRLGALIYALLPTGNLYTYLTTAPATVFATRARSLTTLPLSAG